MTTAEIAHLVILMSGYNFVCKSRKFDCKIFFKVLAMENGNISVKLLTIAKQQNDKKRQQKTMILQLFFKNQYLFSHEKVGEIIERTRSIFHKELCEKSTKSDEKEDNSRLPSPEKINENPVKNQCKISQEN